jgi:cytochrome c biogenesis protein CcmG, thiol:disulfide interchange protein DsbE
MNRQWLLVGLIVAVLAGLVGVGWVVQDRFLPVEVGSRVPDYSARDLEGDPVSLGDLEGEVILLNIWATWCPPCRDEMPSMERLHRKLGPEGLRVVAVSVDALPGFLDASGQSGGNVAEFVREMGLTFDIWHDPDGRIQQAFRTAKVPETFVIDRAGYIVKKDQGARIWDSEDRIESFRRLLEQ